MKIQKQNIVPLLADSNSVKNVFNSLLKIKKNYILESSLFNYCTLIIDSPVTFVCFKTRQGGLVSEISPLLYFWERHGIFQLLPVPCLVFQHRPVSRSE